MALSWDISRGGVFDTEPLGEVAAGSFGSERLPPEVLDLEDPVMPAGDLGVPTGGSPSEEGGSRLGGECKTNSPARGSIARLTPLREVRMQD